MRCAALPAAGPPAQPPTLPAHAPPPSPPPTPNSYTFDFIFWCLGIVALYAIFFRVASVVLLK